MACGHKSLKDSVDLSSNWDRSSLMSWAIPNLIKMTSKINHCKRNHHHYREMDNHCHVNKPESRLPCTQTS